MNQETIQTTRIEAATHLFMLYKDCVTHHVGQIHSFWRPIPGDASGLEYRKVDGLEVRKLQGLVDPVRLPAVLTLKMGFHCFEAVVGLQWEWIACG